MTEYLAALTGLEQVFLGCAVFGGGMFVFRMVLMLVGVDNPDADMDVHGAGDMDMDVDVDHGGDHGDHGGDGDIDIDPGLKLLTLQGLMAFVMMFGLTGFSVSRSSAVGAAVTVLAGCVAGVFGMWLLAKGFSLMRSFQCSGTMNVYDAIGEEGSVYLGIPADGSGQVQITVGGGLKVLAAVSADKVAIKTGDRVVVSEVMNERTLIVRKV